MSAFSDTIAAISTAQAPAAIGVVRVSGKDAQRVVQKIFDKPLSGAPRTAIYGTVRDETGAVVDRAVVTVFRAPASYTGEDVAEISCHGGPYVVAKVLRLLLQNGARQARAGEFTQRAFLNGKLDLAQAEAVADLIDAETEREARQAAGALGGGISEKTEPVRQALIDVCAQISAFVDFPDDEIADVSPQRLLAVAADAHEKVRALAATYTRGALIKSGVKTVICGSPNVGKSRLMNRILGYERSIVTDLAGTTRDVVTETAVLGGVKLRLADTAGLRGATEAVERIGVDRARRWIADADLILFVLDASKPMTDEDRALLDTLRQNDAAKIAVFNKCDLVPGFCPEPLPEFSATVCVSAKTGDGLDALARAVGDLAPEPDGAVVMNLRQYECLLNAENALAHALQNPGVTPDALAVDLEAAAQSLGELTGKTVKEDVLENIFSRFCVGK